MRLLAVVVLLLLLALTALSAALAQAPEPVPTAGPDEIVFVGEVPASPGTTVTVVYLLGGPSEVAVCGTATTTPSPSGNPDISRFVVVVDAACAARALFPPLICSGDGLDDGLCAGEGLTGKPPVAGDTIDTGLLRLPSTDGPTPPPGLVHGDRGPEIALSPTGGGQGLEEPSRTAWLLWAGAALLAAGLAVGGMRVAVRRRR